MRSGMASRERPLLEILDSLQIVPPRGSRIELCSIRIAFDGLRRETVRGQQVAQSAPSICGVRIIQDPRLRCVYGVHDLCRSAIERDLGQWRRRAARASKGGWPRQAGRRGRRFGKGVSWDLRSAAAAFQNSGSSRVVTREDLAEAVRPGNHDRIVSRFSAESKVHRWIAAGEEAVAGIYDSKLLRTTGRQSDFSPEGVS